MLKHIVSFSGGKDSTAMLLRMIELGYQIDEIVFADSKYEFDELYKYIDKIEKHIGMKITRLRTKQEYEDWFYGKWTRGRHEGKIRGYPKVAQPCYWCRESKFKMLDRVCKGNYRYIGIAVDEKHRVTDKKGYIYPLVEWGWTEKDCIKYLEKLDLVNPLYEKFNRLGCWWCPKQSHKSLEVLYNDYPEKWKQLKKWEKDSPHNFKPNLTLDQLELQFSLKKNQISMFELAVHTC